MNSPERLLSCNANDAVEWNANKELACATQIETIEIITSTATLTQARHYSQLTRNSPRQAIAV